MRTLALIALSLSLLAANGAQAQSESSWITAAVPLALATRAKLAGDAKLLAYI